jgi:hypothetical protein
MSIIRAVDKSKPSVWRWQKRFIPCVSATPVGG